MPGKTTPVSITLSPEIVIAAEPSARTEQLCAQTGLARVAPTTVEQPLNSAPFHLNWENNQLTLHDCSTAQTTSVSIDFSSGKNRHRRQQGGGFGQPIARAIKARPGNCPHVCDATGGLGQDAFVFASLGCRVTVLEKSPVVYALLEDAWQRALRDPEIAPIARLMSVHNIDSSGLPDHWPCDTPPSVIYLDPMYPDNRKSAAAKKGMQTLQRILPAFDGAETLLAAAINFATSRVSVKRPRLAPPLNGAKTVGSINTPNTRFDIYKGCG